jgi:hypothetical protein
MDSSAPDKPFWSQHRRDLEFVIGGRIRKTRAARLDSKVEPAIAAADHVR